jgi:hypothetical protein
MRRGPPRAKDRREEPATRVAVLYLLNDMEPTVAIRLDRFNLSKQYVDELRDRSTAAERELCRLLDAELISYVFQSNVCDMRTGRVYVCDFRIRRAPPRREPGTSKAEHRASHNYKLFVEVDGSFHDHRQAYDAKRTRWLEAHRNAQVLRFTNEEIFQRPQFVLAEIGKHHPAKRQRISWSSPQRGSGWNRNKQRKVIAYALVKELGMEAEKAFSASKSFKTAETAVRVLKQRREKFGH